MRSSVNLVEGLQMQTKTVGERIRYLRDRNHMTQKALAERLYVLQQTVSSWETGRTNPDLVLIVEISTLFHVSLDYLLTGKANHTL